VPAIVGGVASRLEWRLSAHGFTFGRIMTARPVRRTVMTPSTAPMDDLQCSSTPLEAEHLIELYAAAARHYLVDRLVVWVSLA
jgi:hypothetical protein